jgi:hypothetical protein
MFLVFEKYELSLKPNWLLQKVSNYPSILIRVDIIQLQKKKFSPKLLAEFVDERRE